MSGTGEEVATVLEDVAHQAGPALAEDFAGAYQGILHETADGLEGNATRVVEHEASAAGNISSIAGGGGGALGGAESDVTSLEGTAARGVRDLTPAGSGGGSEPLGLGDEIQHAQVPGGQGAGADPVDLVSGAMFLPQEDLSLPGLLPLLLERTHRSNYRKGRWFGSSWASTLDQRIEIDDDGIHYAGPDCVVLHYPVPAQPGQEVLPSRGHRWPLTWDRRSDTIRIDQPESGRTLHFPPGPTPQTARRLYSVTDRNDNRITFVCDAEGVPTDVYHSGGYHVVVETEYLAAGPRVSGLRLAGDISGPADSDTPVAQFRYDALGRLTELVNSSGRPLIFEYDDEDRITAWSDRAGQRYEYHYNEAGRVVRTDGTGGFLAARFGYDDAARTTTITDSLGRATVHRHNGLSQVCEIVDALGGVTRIEQDPYNRLLTRTDPLGDTVRYVRDEAGDPVRIVRPDGMTTQIEYNDLRLPTAITEPNGGVWQYTYDERGNLLARTDPAGACTAYERGEHGELLALTDPLGGTTRFETDRAGLPTAVVNPLGEVTRSAYDAFGRISTLTDPLGGTTASGWTVEGRLAWRQAADGAREEWRYDAEGRLAEYRDPNGAATAFEYGPFGKPVARVDPDGARFAFAYDTELRLTSVTNPQGAEWRYEYDALGSLVAEHDFNGRTLRYRHDAAGRLIERTNGAGQASAFTRDADGRVLERQTPDTTYRYAYDDSGRMASATASGPEADITVSYTRDALGRVLSETVDGRTVGYEYDATGRRIARTTPTGTVSRWEYDPAGRVAALATGAGGLSFQYDAAGREISRTLGPGAALSQSFDATGRLTGQGIWAYDQPAADDSADPYRLVQQRTYTYGADGSPVEVDDALRGTRRYTLDAVGRVTAVEAATWREVYAYDALGNLTHATAPGDEDTQGERENTGTTTRRAGRTTYERDAQGRIVRTVRRTLSGQRREWTYRWDADDRLVEVTTPDSATWQYTYDPLGRRVAKHRRTADGAPADQTWLTWEGTRLAEEAHSTVDGQAVALSWDYQPGSYRPVAQTRRSWAAHAPQAAIDQAFRAIVTDLVGTPTELVTADGRIAWHATTSLWGAPTTLGASTNSTGADDCPLRFPGQYHDAETGLNYNYFRYYDPEAAAYLSPDPLGLEPSPNDYGYVLNPLRWLDPLGLNPLAADGAHRGAPDFVTGPGGVTQDVRNIGRPDNELVLSGHGGIRAGDGTPVTVPPGTSVAMYSRHGEPISDALGNRIETANPPPLEVYGPGEQLPDYTLFPPTGLRILGTPRNVTVTGPTRLSDLLQPNQGRVHWAACRVVMP